MPLSGRPASPLREAALIFGVVAASPILAAQALEQFLGGLGAQVTLRGRVALGHFPDVAFPDAPSEGALDDDTLLDGWPSGSGDRLETMQGDFAALGRRDDCLVARRGAFGGRPLFATSLEDGAVVIASRLVPLASLHRGSLRLNLRYLVSFIGPASSPSPGTPFQGVWSVPTGGLVRVAPCGTMDTTFPELQWQATLKGSDDELARAVHDRLAAAVMRTTSTTRHAAVAVSGGIDSSLLLAAAVHCERTRDGAQVVPVTLAYGGPGDDRPHMRALARYLQVTPVEVRAFEGAALGGAGLIVDGQIHALGSASAGTVLLQKAKASGAEVMLMGDGSEWLFDASPSVLGRFAWSSPVLAARTLRRFENFEQPLAQTLRTVGSAVVWSKFPAFAASLRGLRQRPPPSWAGPRLRAFCGELAATPPPALCDQRERVRRAAFSPYLGQASDQRARWEQLGGIRIRYPYLEPEVVELAARLPMQSLFAGKRERGLLREAMRGIVPESVRRRRTKGRPDQAMLEAYEAAGGFQSIRHLADVRELGALGLVDCDSFRREIERFAANPGADWRDWYSLWRVLAAEEHVQWFRDFSMAATGLTR